VMTSYFPFSWKYFNLKNENQKLFIQFYLVKKGHNFVKILTQLGPLVWELGWWSIKQVFNISQQYMRQHKKVKQFFELKKRHNLTNTCIVLNINIIFILSDIIWKTISHFILPFFIF
jgi:hypothetical protein